MSPKPLPITPVSYFVRGPMVKAQRFRVGMRWSYHKVILDVTAKFLAKEIGPHFPQSLAAQRANDLSEIGEIVEGHFFGCR